MPAKPDKLKQAPKNLTSNKKQALGKTALLLSGNNFISTKQSGLAVNINFLSAELNSCSIVQLFNCSTVQLVKTKNIKYMFENHCKTQFFQIFGCTFRKNFSDLLNDRSIVQITNYLWKSKKPSVRSRQNSCA